jgi:hypothetical protein
MLHFFLQRTDTFPSHSCRTHSVEHKSKKNFHGSEVPMTWRLVLPGPSNLIFESCVTLALILDTGYLVLDLLIRLLAVGGWQSVAPGPMRLAALKSERMSGRLYLLKRKGSLVMDHANRQSFISRRLLA